MANDPSFYKAAEGRAPDDRLRDQEAALRRILQRAIPHAPAVRRTLEEAGVTASAMTIADLERVPLLRKDRLPALQAEAPPFGGWLGRPLTAARRIFASPGPIYEPEGGEGDYWGFAPALHAAGFRPGDLVLNTFSYHLTPAGAMFDGALAALQCVTVPSGVGNLEIQVRTLIDLSVSGFIGTPGFLSIVLARVAELGVASPVRAAFVSGEPLAESLRGDLERRFGLRISQGYAIGDLGLIAYECPERTGFHLDDRVIVELVEPATGHRVPPGEAGEVAVTFLHDLYPLLRLATGDLSRVAPGVCPCGRTAPRLERILGRVGDAVKVRGLFVHPHELDRAMAAHPSAGRFQAIITRPGHQDELTIVVESAAAARADLAAAVARTIHEETRLRAAVEVVVPGTIPADGKKIVDRRTWE